MSILGFFLILVVLALAAWFINNYLEMDPKLKSLANVIIGIAVVLLVLFFCLQVLGINTGAHLSVR